MLKHPYGTTIHPKLKKIRNRKKPKFYEPRIGTDMKLETHNFSKVLTPSWISLQKHRDYIVEQRKIKEDFNRTAEQHMLEHFKRQNEEHNRKQHQEQSLESRLKQIKQFEPVEEEDEIQPYIAFSSPSPAVTRSRTRGRARGRGDGTQQTISSLFPQQRRPRRRGRK